MVVTFSSRLGVAGCCANCFLNLFQNEGLSSCCFSDACSFSDCVTFTVPGISD